MALSVLKLLHLLVTVAFLAAGTTAQYSPSAQPTTNGDSHEKPIGTTQPTTNGDSHEKPMGTMQSLDEEKPLESGTLSIIEPALESSPNQSTFLGNAINTIVKRKLYKKEKERKKKEVKRKISSSYKRKMKNKIKKVTSSSTPKEGKKKVVSKPKTYKNKVISQGKKAATKYKTRNPALRSYIPKGTSRRMMNHIDACWRNDPNWAKNRAHLADCAVGYGFDAMGGKDGNIYIVTDPSDDPVSPKPGTLRYGVVQMQPLWIIFDHDMTITLENELIFTSYKTIDGRGARVEIAHGPCFTIQFVDHIIIHGLSMHHCTAGKSGRVMSSTEHVGKRQGSDGDAIVMFGSSHIWIDHNYFAECQDGLVDAIHGSTAITISNNFFTNHDKVMLLGHSDSYSADKGMRTTLVYNHFGPGLIQRMPRCRFGYFHIANNRYTQWGMYAIGASANPTIKSEGNYFLAPNDERFKQVVKLEGARKTSSSNWKSNGDLFLNGAYFGEDGTSTYNPSYPDRQENFDILPANLVPLLTADAGPLYCKGYSHC